MAATAAAISTFKPVNPNPNPNPNPSPSPNLKPSSFTCKSSSSLTPLLSSEPTPLLSSVRTFAPATVANLGPAFDFLGAAVDDIGDHVTLSLDPSVTPGHLIISSIYPSTNKLSSDPLSNCAGIAALSAMKLLNIRSFGLSLTLEKGLPLGSGLGSSAASAAASAAAVNALFGGKLSNLDLVKAGLESESRVSGYHADNIAPAIMGGFVLIRSYEPLELVTLDFPEDKDLIFVLVSPEFEAPTKKMRAALPKEIGMPHHIWNSSQAAALVVAVLKGDVEGLGKALSSDRVVEPRRAPLIPGMDVVKKAAIKAGAFGCTISGAGPTAVAITDSVEKGEEIGLRMVKGFMKGGDLRAVAHVKRLDRVGARVVSSTPL